MAQLRIEEVGGTVLHEFGHAYACKRFGGEVPEMGLVFILSAPCAYVDASASWKFTSKWHRIAVGLAGMYVESFVAAIFALTPASSYYWIMALVVSLRRGSWAPLAVTSCHPMPAPARRSSISVSGSVTSSPKS